MFVNIVAAELNGVLIGPQVYIKFIILSYLHLEDYFFTPTLTYYLEMVLQTASDWLYVYPKGIHDLVLYTKEKYNDPLIYITENGM